MIEHYFTCPYCWETISMMLDTSIMEQKYVEDCEVCCNPIEVSVVCNEGNIAQFSAVELGQ